MHPELTEEERDKETPELKRVRIAAQAELQRAELLSLFWCLASPVLGAYLLQLLRDHLSDGSDYLNSFNVRLFMLTAGIKPWTHAVSLVRRRLLLLQEEVHYPHSQVDQLNKRLRQMESELSTLRKLFATKSDVRLLRDGIDLPLTQLSRAVRKYEKKEEHLRLSAEDKFNLVESRLEDLLREVAINAELIESERQERERAANLPMSVFQAVRFALGQRTSSNRHYLHDAPRSLPSASALGIGPSDGGLTPTGASKPTSPVRPEDSGAVPPARGSQSPQMSYAPETRKGSWYERGSMYYLFLPLNLTNSALKFAGDKARSLTEDASGSVNGTSNAAAAAYYHGVHPHHHPAAFAAQQHGPNFKRIDHAALAK